MRSFCLEGELILYLPKISFACLEPDVKVNICPQTSEQMPFFLRPSWMPTYDTKLLDNQGEDCLYLDVFIPTKIYYGKKKLILKILISPLDEKSKGTRKPSQLANLLDKDRAAVLVFLPGNTFNDGGNSWLDPSTIVSFGSVITVRIQYRLGPFGWLRKG